MIFVIIYPTLALFCIGFFVVQFDDYAENPGCWMLSFLMSLVFPIVILIWSGMKLSKKLKGVI